MELLVVVSLVAFLASVSLVALASAQAKSRDSKRQVDAFMIIKAADLYYNDYGHYPTSFQGLALGQPDSRPTQALSFLGKVWHQLVSTAQARFNISAGDTEGGAGCPPAKYCQGQTNCVTSQTGACVIIGSDGLCNVNADCATPIEQADYFVCDDEEGSNWLFGLDPYISYIPEDPGRHQDAGHNKYCASSHPAIVGVGQHGYCFFWSYEKQSNNIADSTYEGIDISKAPLQGDAEWSVLCAR